jgi:2-succinyl-5-enolpyruvyl-6-hydroxy-3-cyclohexene-1-carboxylate synthase
MGSAAASVDKSFIHITGDVAFHYDVNGLWNDNFEGRLKIIVINNGGGGIFRIIEGPNKVQERREFIEAAITTNAEKLQNISNGNTSGRWMQRALGRLWIAFKGRC